MPPATAPHETAPASGTVAVIERWVARVEHPEDCLACGACERVCVHGAVALADHDRRTRAHRRRLVLRVWRLRGGVSARGACAACMGDRIVKVAIASGKGGTGKTTVAVNLARVAADAGLRVQLLDCDVEEPDCALFLRPQVHRTLPVELSIPEVDEAACTHCGICSDVCEFRAIISLPTDGTGVSRTVSLVRRVHVAVP